MERGKMNHIRKAALVDTIGNVTYSIAAGAALDYLSGLNLTGIIASRLAATKLNILTSAPYGLWREKMFKTTHTTEHSNRIRKSLVDLAAFNTFQVPVYATAIAIGSLVSEGRIDLHKMQHGAEYLVAVSPFIGPTLGIYMDSLRKFVGVSSAAGDKR